MNHFPTQALDHVAHRAPPLPNFSAPSRAGSLSEGVHPGQTSDTLRK